jgi:hypothetical protein
VSSIQLFILYSRSVQRNTQLLSTFTQPNGETPLLRALEEEIIFSLICSLNLLTFLSAQLKKKHSAALRVRGEQCFAARARPAAFIVSSCAAFHHILGCVWQSLAAMGALM